VRGFLLAADVSGRSRADEAGVCMLESVPSTDISLEVRVDGRTFRSTLPAGEPEHTLVVPAWRSCVIRVADPRATHPEAKHRISLRPVTPGEGEAQTRTLGSRANEVAFQRVFHGTYEAKLERVEKGSVVWTSDPVEVRVDDSGPNPVILGL